MFDTYIMNDNDTLDDIAYKYNIDSSVLKKINENNLDSNKILVPKNSNLFSYYVINKGDTLYKIANNIGIDVNLLAELNGINIDDYIYPEQILLVPKAGTILYITASGDTLGEIAKGINVDIMDLVKQNKNIYLQSDQLIVYKRK